MNGLSEVMLERSKMYNTANQALVDSSRPGGIPIAIDELQKITHGLEELTICLRSRLLPVLREDNSAKVDNNSNAPDPIGSPMEHQLRLLGRQLQLISANVDDILKHLEV